MPPQSHRTKVFISYSHRDAVWLDRLKVYLKRMEHRIEFWDDKRLEAGARWREELGRVIGETKVAVLLVSEYFMGSNFIQEKELPPLLHAAKEGEIAIIPVIVNHSSFLQTPELGQFQPSNDPSKPLVDLKPGARAAALLKVSTDIEKALEGRPAPGPVPEGQSAAEGGDESESPEGGVTSERPGIVPQPQPGSEKPRARPSAPPRRKSPPRWKTFVFPFLVGLGMGIIGALVFGWVASRRAAGPPVGSLTPALPPAATPDVPAAAPNQTGATGQETVYIFGSGTVYRYLRSLDPHLIENLKKHHGVNVQILEGPTLTGASVFAHVHDQMNPSHVLVMASRKLSSKPLSRSAENPSALFEFYLGADTLEMLLVTGPSHRDEPPSTWADNNIETLKKVFPHLIETGREEKLLITKLTDPTIQWAPQIEYDHDGVYAGANESATLGLWRERLGNALPKGLKLWDIRIEGQMVGLTPGTRIYLGSEELNRKQIDELKTAGIYHKKLTMVERAGDGKSEMEVKRGLYIYGAIKVPKDEGGGQGKRSGYTLERPVVAVLHYLFNLLERKPKLLSPDCYRKQKQYFNLGPEVRPETGWVNPGDRDSSDLRMFRVRPCEERPVEAGLP